MNCKICGKEFGTYGLAAHLAKSHSITSKEYYDKYLKKEDDEGMCKRCGKSLNFRGLTKGYPQFCSSDCAQKSQQTKDKLRKVMNERYDGIGCASPIIKQKMEKTNLDKYGVKNNFCAGPLRDKMIEKRELETGYKYPLSNPEIIQKGINTCLSKYGVTNYGASEQSKKEKREMWKTIEYRQKFRDTRVRNGSFAKSKDENKVFKLLDKKFNEVIREYISDKYPFFCDFYIPEFDLYIECNFHWTHGPHWFDKNDKEDVRILNFWKSKRSDYYDVAVNVWSIKDLEKKKIAEQNELNYLVFWNLEEAIFWVNNI